MNKVTAEEVAKMAAKEAVEEFYKQMNREVKTKTFQNTKFLMESYKEIKEHVEKGIADVHDMEREFSESGVDEDELFIYSIKKSKMRSMIMIAHIEKCLELLRRSLESKGREDKYIAYKCFYIDGLTYEQIEEQEGYNERTVRRWITELNQIMGTYLFGVDVLKIV